MRQPNIHIRTAAELRQFYKDKDNWTPEQKATFKAKNERSDRCIRLDISEHHHQRFNVIEDVDDFLWFSLYEPERGGHQATVCLNREEAIELHQFLGLYLKGEYHLKDNH